MQLDSTGGEFLLKPSNLVPFATTSNQSNGGNTPNSSTSSTSSSTHSDDTTAEAALPTAEEEEDPLPSEHFIVDPQEPRYAHVYIETRVVN